MDDYANEGYFGNESATFGDRVFAGRDALGMSQEELARRLGVKRKTVANWEEDLAEPRANKLQMLAGILNVSVMWLLTGEGDGVRAPADEGELPADAAAIMVELRQTRAEFQRMTDTVARLEKRLGRALNAQG